MHSANHQTSLFKSFPRLPLAELPTPVVKLPTLGKQFGHDCLFMKRDDLSGPVYGGNKIRKLEFLLGEALTKGCKTVVTYGAAGSNHALATAICCRQAGLNAVSILAPQKPSDHVRKNMLAGFAAGAELVITDGFSEFPKVTAEISRRCKERDGIEPYIIPAGGSNAVGALGFVKAALELAEQVQPDVIYVPMGTGGTLAGLLVGFLLADVNLRIEAIRVVERAFRNESHIKALCDELCIMLGIEGRVLPERIIIRDEFFGGGYGLPTPEGREALDLYHTFEGVILEDTYTSKTAAALLHDLRAGRLDGKTVLQWHTLNSRELSGLIAGVDCAKLPPEVQAYVS